MRTQSSALQRLRQNRDLLLWILVLTIVVSGIVGPTIALHRNVLTAHPRWVSSKTQLEKGVMGALAFVNLQQGLAGNRLNLGAWFGYQEVLYRESLELASLSLNFQLEAGGYIHVLYDYRESGFSGLRFSSNPDFPDIHYAATPSGEFLVVEELDLGVPVSARELHDVRLDFAGNEVTVILDEQVVGRFERIPGPQRIGMRGSQRNTWVDDVVLTRLDGATFREDFANHRVTLPVAVATFVLLLLVALVAVACFARSQSTARRTGLWVAMVYMVLIVVCAVAYVSQRFSARDYPSLTGSTLEVEAYWINSSRASIMQDLEDRYTVESAPNSYRILFMGGSQTWGAGALHSSDTWVRQTERLLNVDDDEARYVCINGGVSGFTSTQILAFLRDHLLDFRPRAAVFNIGNNDTDPVALGEGFEAILDLLSEHQVRPILVLEANSTEKLFSDSRHGDLFVKHRVLADMAAARGVPVIDMHEHLASRRDAGFVWWDFSHLTSFGQRIVAEHLRSRLPAALGVK